MIVDIKSWLGGGRTDRTRGRVVNSSGPVIDHSRILPKQKLFHFVIDLQHSDFEKHNTKQICVESIFQDFPKWENRVAAKSRNCSICKE
jgi:hypothetical protein